MKKLAIFLLSFMFLLAASSSSVHAWYQPCQYGSTQARIQKDVSKPWKQSITVDPGQGFSVGGFHNNSGEFAADVYMFIVGPENYSNLYNSQTITPQMPGKYTLIVKTNNQYGAGCQDQATVTVRQTTACQYGSTQARVQKDVTQDWTQYLSLKKGLTFNVGGFHNNSGQFASDIKITFNGKTYKNADTITATKLGWNEVKVTTKGKTGAACQESAWVNVKEY